MLRTLSPLWSGRSGAVLSYTAAFRRAFTRSIGVHWTAVSCLLRLDYDAEAVATGRVFDLFLDNRLTDRRPGNQPNVATQIFDHELLRTSTTKPIIPKLVTLFLTRAFHRRILHIEDKDSTFSQIMQWFGTFRIRAVAHHLSSPLRLQWLFCSSVDWLVGVFSVPENSPRFSYGLNYKFLL